MKQPYFVQSPLTEVKDTNRHRRWLQVGAWVVTAMAILLLYWQQQALQLLKTENEAMRQELEIVRKAASQVDTLRQQMDALSAQVTDPRELMRLRAESAEWRRLRAELARTEAALSTQTSPSIASPPVISSASPSPTYVAKGSAPLKPGESLITGGWQMGEDKRGYALVTPSFIPSDHGQTVVLMESRVFSLPNAKVEEAGLLNLISTGAEAERYGVTDAKLTADLLKRLQAMPGVEVLSSPRVMVQTGQEATIQVGASPTAGANGLQLRLLPNLPVDGQGFHLDFDLSLALPD